MKPLSPGSRDDAGETAPLECQACLWSSTQTIRPAVASNSAVGISSPWIRDANWLLPLHKHTWRAPHTRLRFNHFRPQTLYGRPRYSKWWPYVGPYYIPLLVKEKLISLLEATSSTIWPVRSSTLSISSKFTLKAKPFPTSTRRCVEKWGEIFPGSMIIRSSWHISSSLVHVLQVFELHHGLVHLTKTARNTVLIDSTSRFSDHLFNCVESNTFFSETYNYLTTCLRNYGCAVMTVKNSAANVVRKPVWPCRFGCYYHFELLLFLFKLLLIHILWILDGKTQYWIKKPKTLKSLVLMLTPWCLEW